MTHEQRRTGKVVADWVRNANGSAWLSMGSVDPDFRSRGIGLSALGVVEERARNRGCKAIEMCVDDSNPRARDLYLRNGYVAVAPYVDEHDEAAQDGSIVHISSPGVLLRKPL